MPLTVQPVAGERIHDLGRLFSSDEIASRCWCMWFIIPVKEFHAAAAEGNRAAFANLAAKSNLPLGLIAYREGEPVGWVAIGPRSRYVRALKTPTYRGGEEGGDGSSTWLVPCFFVHPECRGSGTTRAMLEAAVRFAAENGANAIEGFPYSEGTRRYGGDMQVGFEAVFRSCGFEVVRTPSASRVVMRRALIHEAPYD